MKLSQPSISHQTPKKDACSLESLRALIENKSLARTAKDSGNYFYKALAQTFRTAGIQAYWAQGLMPGSPLASYLPTHLQPRFIRVKTQRQMRKLSRCSRSV